MDMDSWKLSDLCVGIHPWPGVEVEDEETLQQVNSQLPNEHLSDLVVEQCKKVCEKLKMLSLAFSSTPNAGAPKSDNQQPAESIPFSPFGTTRYLIEERKDGVTEGFDVNIILEINTDNHQLPSFAFLVNKFQDILVKNSRNLGLDPLSISCNIQPPEYVLGFQFVNDNGSHTVDIRLAHADVCFAPV